MLRGCTITWELSCHFCLYCWGWDSSPPKICAPSVDMSGKLKQFYCFRLVCWGSEDPWFENGMILFADWNILLPDPLCLVDFYPFEYVLLFQASLSNSEGEIATVPWVAIFSTFCARPLCFWCVTDQKLNLWWCQYSISPHPLTNEE